MVLALLGAVARRGRWGLVAGLCAGLLMPDVAAVLRVWLPEMVALLLFMTALRIGPRAALGSLGDARLTVVTALVFQLVLPLLALLVFRALGVAHMALPLAVVLMLAAPSVTGGANFTILLGYDPAPALRMLVVGTALLPLTVVPVLWGAPMLGDAGAVVLAALRLVAVIGGAVALAFAMRWWLWKAPGPEAMAALDGLTVIALAVIVVGLMAALGPALERDPGEVVLWLVAVMAVNFGLQALCYVVLRRMGRDDAVPVSIVAGNRNIALFLVALPAEITGPLLIFIGCYQIPMYLTPVLMGRLYGRGSG